MSSEQVAAWKRRNPSPFMLPQQFVTNNGAVTYGDLEKFNAACDQASVPEFKLTKDECTKAGMNTDLDEAELKTWIHGTGYSKDQKDKKQETGGGGGY